MRRLLAFLASAFLLFSPFTSWPAETEADGPRTSSLVLAHPPEADPLAATRAGLGAVRDEASKPPDVVLQRLWQLQTGSASGGYFEDADLARLKRTLSQVRVDPQPETPRPRPQGHGDRVDLTLERSIEIALKKNLSIRLIALAKDSVGLEVPKAEAIFYPTVGAMVAASGSKSSSGGQFTSTTGPGGTPIIETIPVTEQDNQGGSAFITQALPTGATLTFSSDLTRSVTSPSEPPEQYNTDLRVSLVQPLLRGGRIYVATRPIRDAELDLRVANAQLQAEILRVTARTKANYYNLLLAEKVIGVTQAAIDRDQLLVDASQALFKAGLVTKRDVFSAELSVAQDSARLVNTRADLENARNALLDVLGLPIGTEVRLIDKVISFEPITLELERWIATATANRPEILDLETQIEKRLLNIKVARNTLLPQLDLAASYGRNQTAPSFGKSFSLSGDAWSVGLLFSVPIGNVAARSALAQAEIERSRLQEQLSQMKRQVELEVRAAVIKLQKSLERMRALTAAIDQAKGKLEVGRAQFALGQATNLDITDAQQALLSSESDLLAAMVDYNVGLAELEARIAGTIQPR